MPSPLPPFAVPPVHFPFRALAARAGRAPMGGEREVALGALMIARLASDAVGPHALPEPVRKDRAAAAKAWLASLALPARARPAMARALEATARDTDAVTGALHEVVRALTPWLDEPCLAELRAIVAPPLVNSR